MPCQSYSLEDLLILNKPLRTADTCSLTIFPVTICMYWWGWFHEDDAVGTNYLTVVFLLIPLGFFNLQLLVFPPLLVTKESIKNRRNVSIMHRYMRGTLDLFYFKKSCKLHWVSKHGKRLLLVPLFLFCSFVYKLSSFSVTFRKLWRIFNLASDALGGAVAWIIRHIELLLSWLDLVYLL